MQLGFVSAILPELSLTEVMAFAAEAGYDCVEVMCWPKGKAERRYAGVTHIDVANLDEAEIDQVHQLVEKTGGPRPPCWKDFWPLRRSLPRASLLFCRRLTS